MKICFFTATFLPTIGGAELVLHNLATSLTELGHRIVVIAPKIRGKDNNVEANYRIFRYQRPSSKRFGVRQTLLYLLWEKVLNGFDLLHCHGAYPPGYVGATFKRLFRTPIVIRPHGSDILPGEQIRCNPRLDRRVRTALGAADRVIAQSRALEEELMRCGVPKDRIRLIPNGVRVAEYRETPQRRAPEVPYLFAMGSFTRKKGFDVLIRAFSMLRPSHPGVRLVIAGEGPERGTYDQLITELRLKDAVSFVGVVSGQKKVELFKGCRLFICPSRREPFATVNLEAMAAGKAIVATRVGGNREVIIDGDNGLLVEPEDPRALAEAISTLLNDSALSERMSCRSLDLIQRYEWSSIVERYLMVVQEVVPLKRTGEA